jgi:hypothetical protein
MPRRIGTLDGLRNYQQDQLLNWLEPMLLKKFMIGCWEKRESMLRSLLYRERCQTQSELVSL